MIDAHCHILPDMDDGPATVEESAAMAKIAAEDGIEKIIATPHVTDNRFLPTDITERVDELNHFLNQKDIPVQVYPGAEVSTAVDPEIMARYTLCRSPYILIEFPHSHLPSFAGNMFQWLCAKGLKPIIAHPERNYSVIRSPESLLPLLNNNIYVQITAASLTGDFGRDIRYCADFLLSSGKVDIIASDAHSEHFRIPNLSAALEAAATRLGKKAAARLVCENPAAVLNGKELHTAK